MYIIVNAIPLIIFVIVCLVGKSDTQIMLAEILSILYAMLMMAVFITILIQILHEGFSSPNMLALGLVFGPIFVAAILHPQVYQILSKLSTLLSVIYVYCFSQ